MTKDLTKNQEKDINNEITLIKRKIKEAESSGNIEIKLEEAEDRKDELDDRIDKIKAQKEPLDKEYKLILEELDKKNLHITGLKNVKVYQLRRWQSKRPRRMMRNSVTIRSTRTGNKTKRSVLINSKKKSPRSRRKTPSFGMSITRNLTITGSRSTSSILSNGRSESKTEKLEIKKERPERLSMRREIKRERKKISSESTWGRLNSSTS
jgi:hypothetical protein